MKNPISDVRRRYIVRLGGRILVLLACIFCYVFEWVKFDILKDFQFFKRLSALHALWFVWVLDMVFQLLPAKNIALGSQKLFKVRFRPVLDKINVQALKKYIIGTTQSAYKVFILWGALIAAIGLLHHFEMIRDVHLFLISVLFYVCDLICVLIWCPFRLIMKNKCCTTCRIFNWDHLMMFTPMLFIRGFFSWSLIFISVLVFIVWEVCVILYPERF